MEKEKNERFETAEEQGPMTVVGRNPVLELFKSGREIEKLYIQRGEREGSITKIFALAKDRMIPASEVDKKRLDSIAGGNAHQGVAAVTSSLVYVSVADMVRTAQEKGQKPLIVVCDGIEDPHNIGAILRSAEGAGAHGVVLSKRHCSVIGQTVFKASAGAAAYVPIAKVSNIASAVDELKRLGVWLYAASMDGICYTDVDFDGACAIVLGNEGDGISRLVREKCDFTVSIPMYGRVSSLNVSAAAAILLFDAAGKQRKS